MTREEKIAILKDIIAGEIIHPQVRKDVGEWAIKALEQEPFINKSCVSSGVCEHDKNKVFDKIRAEIEKLRPNLRPEQMTDYDYAMVDVINDIVAIINKYKAESEIEE